MKRSWLFKAVGALVLFVSVFAPIMTLVAWISQYKVWPFLLVAAFLSVLGFFSFWHTLNKSENMARRWLWMQVLGLGTVLMSLVILGSVFTLSFNTQSVGLWVMCAWVLLSLLAIWQALSIKKRYLSFSAPNLPTSLRMVQISDVHIGSRSAQFLSRVVDQLNIEKPDLVVITGDLLDASAVDEHDLKALGQIESPVFMCIGNHERYVDLEKAIRCIESHGVSILRDAETTYRGLQIIGIDDRDKPDALSKVFEDLNLAEAAYSVLLYHRPDGWQAAKDNNINLTLSGHTHAGQMFPFGLLVKRRYPQMAGLFTSNNQSLYVSVGTGTWGPIFRLGTRSEMTVIDLASSPSIDKADNTVTA